MQGEAAQLHERIINNIHPADCQDDSLLGGTTGLIYFYYHHYLSLGDARYLDLGEKTLTEVIQRLKYAGIRVQGMSFGNGLAGLAYLLSDLLRHELIDEELSPQLGEFDEHLYQWAVNSLESDQIDYLHGAMGIVHYFNGRAPAQPAMRYLNELVELLCKNAVHEANGIWFRNALVQKGGQVQVNFGLSHGLSGILLLLLNAYDHCDDKYRIENVIKQGIGFMLKHRLDPDFSKGHFSSFPFSFSPGHDELAAPNRLGWCYGDLNQVLLLYRAGKRFNDSTYEKIADLIGAQTTLRRSNVATMVNDSYFCHGASGLAQFYRTLHRETGHEMYRQAYEYWIKQTLELFNAQPSERAAATDLLEGNLGVGLTLLSYLYEESSDWSRVFLL